MKDVPERLAVLALRGRGQADNARGGVAVQKRAIGLSDRVVGLVPDDEVSRRTVCRASEERVHGSALNRGMRVAVVAGGKDAGVGLDLGEMPGGLGQELDAVRQPKHALPLGYGSSGDGPAQHRLARAGRGDDADCPLGRCLPFGDGAGLVWAEVVVYVGHCVAVLSS
jgi:hypothetical protein